MDVALLRFNDDSRLLRISILSFSESAMAVSCVSHGGRVFGEKFSSTGFFLGEH